MKLQQANSINLANIVDYCCETHFYTSLSEEEIFREIARDPYFWRIVEKKFKSKNLQKKKNEILYVVAVRFGILFSQQDRNFLLKNPSCTFEDVSAIINRAKLNQHR